MRQSGSTDICSPKHSLRSKISLEVTCDDISVADAEWTPHMPLGCAAHPRQSCLDVRDFRHSRQLLAAPSRFCQPQSIWRTFLVSASLCGPLLRVVLWNTHGLATCHSGGLPNRHPNSTIKDYPSTDHLP